MSKKTNFSFYQNKLCISFQNPSRDGQMLSDFLMEGDDTIIVNGLVNQMEKHPQAGEIISTAALIYLQRKGQKKS